MRKDSIADAALKQAYELYQFSEKGFHGSGIDADDVPVLAPQVSKLKKEDEPWNPESAFYGNKPRGSGPPVLSYGEEQGTGEYNSMEKQLTKLMSMQENLSGQLRRARQLGNFQEEHRIVQERNDVMKAISAVEAQMMVLDNGRFRRGMNDGMMYESQNHQDEANPFEGDDEENFSEFVSMINTNDRKIAELEAALLSFAEGKNLKSPGADDSADPGQSYSTEDSEEDDEEEDDDEVLGNG
jgi:hypothetical protein